MAKERGNKLYKLQAETLEGPKEVGGQKGSGGVETLVEVRVSNLGS